MTKMHLEQKVSGRGGMPGSGNRQGRASRLAAGLVALALALPAMAGPREQAKRMHDRLTGVPPTPAVLDAMEAAMANPEAAALLAIDPASNPENARYFYTVTLKNFATPWTNEAQSVFDPLNDYSATIIGMVRDDTPFDQLFSLDYVYAGKGSLPGVTATVPSPTSNAHYEQLEAAGIDLSDPANFGPVSQVTAVGLPSAAGAAGIFTTRAAARAFFVDGTNRAMFRFTLLNHLCKDMEQIKDTTRAADRIRQDVSRSPGGDSRIYMNACLGCHAGMDPMTQAFAYYDFTYPAGNPDAGRLVYTPGQVQPKYLINADNFKYGYITPDDRWDNYWREGPNAVLGWDSSKTGSGTGARSMGEELASSAAFGRCQAIKVFRAVCLREPNDAEINGTNGLYATYVANGAVMKPVFAKAATQCMGQ